VPAVGRNAVSKSKNRGRAVARLEWSADSDNAHADGETETRHRTDDDKTRRNVGRTATRRKKNSTAEKNTQKRAARLSRRSKSLHGARCYSSEQFKRAGYARRAFGRAV
jgi:hypothetical protein